MSSKLLAIMASPEDPGLKLESNLMVGVTKEGYCLNVSDYGVALELNNPYLIASNSDGFPLWLYFQFRNHRSSDLRNRYFDIIRALGLREMWFMWEDLSDYFDLYTDSIPIILSKMASERRPEEFAERSLHEFNLKELLEQTPYEDDVYPYGMFYHDTFADLFQKVDEIESRENVIVLGLTEFEEGTIRVMRPDSHIVGLKLY